MTLQVRVGNGKYTFVQRLAVGAVEILRHGEPWHLQVDASNAIRGLMTELDAARVVLDVARRMGDDAPLEIKLALSRHRALVDDHELPSDWAE